MAVSLYGLEVKSETSTSMRSVDLRNFEPIRVLGKGVYGKVVLVYDRTADLNLAIKLISAQPDPDNVRQWLDIMNEKQILEKLASHDSFSFSQCYFTTVTRQYAWFGFKYYAGGTIKDLIQTFSTPESKLAFSGAQALVAEVLMAVKKLHSKHILHRDIKPDNFLFNDQGHVVLSDFGLSVTMDKTKPLEQQVSREYFIDTNEFTAPEMTFCPAEYSFPADIFSVGKLIGVLCAEANQDGAWSDEAKGDIVSLQAALAAEVPCERASIKGAAKHRFFRGIRFKEVLNGTMNMSQFGQDKVVLEKPESHGTGIDLGCLESATHASPIMSNFCSFQRYLALTH
eukprot:TRINITY_DN45317_c0_g1_i15.p1 TRINITY_DN45317_c0_g1~~TRINITY_DN45317_c0_g1_i15.p1  ORF type:complete len:341 (-),score=28.70 TRINITY_DN45317_c0_g1_i15:470-1492(-)